jgi:hypothetical protein
MLGTFVPGCILTAAVMHAAQPKIHSASPDTTGASGAPGS